MTLGNGTLAGFFGSDTFTTIENVDLQGGSGNDTLNASAYTAGPVTLRGGNDANTVGNGNDTLVGGAGNDFLVRGRRATPRLRQRSADRRARKRHDPGGL